MAVVGGARTPFAKAGTALKDHSALELAARYVNGVLEKLDLDPAAVEQLVYGAVIVDPTIPHLAREVGFNSELPAEVRALTVTDNCISGTSAIASVHDTTAPQPTQPIRSETVFRRSTELRVVASVHLGLRAQGLLSISV